MWSRVVALLSRLRFALARQRVDDEARSEFESHLELLTDRYIRLGMRPDEARRAASRQFGNALLVREELHQMNGIGWLEELATDVRYGLRLLRRNRGYAAVAILTLALGVGANAAVFSVVNATLIQPLPFADAGATGGRLRDGAQDRGGAARGVVPQFPRLAARGPQLRDDVGRSRRAVHAGDRR